MHNEYIKVLSICLRVHNSLFNSHYYQTEKTDDAFKFFYVTIILCIYDIMSINNGIYTYFNWFIY